MTKVKLGLIGLLIVGYALVVKPWYRYGLFVVGVVFGVALVIADERYLYRYYQEDEQKNEPANLEENLGISQEINSDSNLIMPSQESVVDSAAESAAQPANYQPATEAGAEPVSDSISNQFETSPETILDSEPTLSAETNNSEAFSSGSPTAVQLVTRSVIFLITLIPLAIFVMTSTGSALGSGLVLGLLLMLLLEMWDYRSMPGWFNERFLTQLKNPLTGPQINWLVWAATAFFGCLNLLMMI